MYRNFKLVIRKIYDKNLKNANVNVKTRRYLESKWLHVYHIILL